jgi:uncharacterized protein YjiS (DUF1127 family)
MPMVARIPGEHASLLGYLRAWWRYQGTVWYLSNLGDRELADIGISRKDITRVACESPDPIKCGDILTISDEHVRELSRLRLFSHKLARLSASSPWLLVAPDRGKKSVVRAGPVAMRHQAADEHRVVAKRLSP